MNGGVLNNIFRKLTNRYGEDAMNIMFDYGDDVAEKGVDSFLGQLTSRKVKNPDSMIAGHALSTDSFLHNHSTYDGKLINPSLQINKLSDNMSSIDDFGDIYLLGSKSMVNPRQAPIDVYSRDAWTGRHPHIEKNAAGDDVISGTDLAPTVDNISSYMRDMRPQYMERGYRNGSPSALAAKFAKKHDSLGDILLGADDLPKGFESLDHDKKYMANDRLIGEVLTDRMGVAYPWELPRLSTDEGKQMYNKFVDDIFALDKGDLSGVSPGEKDTMMEILDGVKNAPAAYKEVKYREPLGMDKFSSAYIPAWQTPEGKILAKQQVVDALNQYGVDLIPYLDGRRIWSNAQDGLVDVSDRAIRDRRGAPIDGTISSTINQSLAGKNRFNSQQILSAAGALPLGAGVLGSLLGGQNDEQQYI